MESDRKTEKSGNTACCSPMQIYRISGLKELSAGSRKGNLIRSGTLEAFQFLLVRSEDGHWYMGQDGSRLKFGQTLAAGGLRLVWLGDFLAVGSDGECELETLLQEKILSAGQIAGEMQENTAPDRGTVIFRRSPRGTSGLHEETVELELPPEQPPERKESLLLTAGPALTMTVPMLLGCSVTVYAARTGYGGGGIYLYLGLVTAVSSAGLAFFWSLARMREDKKREIREKQLRREEYGEYLQKIRRRLSEEAGYNTAMLHQLYPSAEECLQYTEKRPELWNRSPGEKDFLFARMGLGSVPFQVHLEMPKTGYRNDRDPLVSEMRRTAEEFRYLKSVPFGVSLQKDPVLGFAGSGAVRLMQLAAAQLSSACSGSDLKLGFFWNRENTDNRDWDCFRLFPHVWSEDGNRRLLAADREEAEEILAYLAGLFRKRGEEKENRHPHYVLFFQEPSALQGEWILRCLLNRDGDIGLSAVFLADRPEELPFFCRTVVFSDGRRAVVRNPEAPAAEQAEFVPDRVSRRMLENFGKRTAGIRTGEERRSHAPPEQPGFLRLHNACTVQELSIAENWKSGRTWQNIRARIGYGADGEICFLDIHEKHHGPHGLIAGATGSGKSVLLEAFLLSLAVRYSPEDISFFIIDFKGGGLANQFEGIPHLAGSITNLSGSRIQRALLSVKSENRRRQRLLAAVGVNHIDAYTRLVKSGRAEEPMPHLLLVIDEFAELKREFPDFMQELISVAQVGRSLGIHLILATQKPGGTVSESIWSNSRFRICLRVQSRQDSMDMLRHGDAAGLVRPGQAYLQVGNDEIFRLFQAACPEYPYEGEAGRYRNGAVMLTRTGARAVQPLPVQSRESELDAVIGEIKRTAQRQKTVPCRPLWLPSLPDRITLAELEKTYPDLSKTGGREEPPELKTPVGLLDDPEHQRQLPLEVNFTEKGHMAVCGTAFCGKSTFLHTMLSGLLQNFGADRLQVLVLDFSSHLLEELAGREQVLAVLGEGEEDRTEEWMKKLEEEMNFRRKYGAGHRPDVLLVIDQLPEFRRETCGRYDDLLEALAVCGRQLRLYLAVSAAGFGIMEIPFRLAENIPQIFCLEQTEPLRYQDCLRVNRLSVCPEPGHRGRGLAAVCGSVLEFQTALAVSKETPDIRRQAEAVVDSKKASDIREQQEALTDNRQAARRPDKETERTCVRGAQKKTNANRKETKL